MAFDLSVVSMLSAATAVTPLPVRLAIVSGTTRGTSMLAVVVMIFSVNGCFGGVANQWGCRSFIKVV